MAGFGTGYPNFFNCPVATRNRELWGHSDRSLAGRLPDGHKIELTGRTKKTPRNGKGHPRKSWTTFEYRCQCGHVGWSSHKDLCRIALRTPERFTFYPMVYGDRVVH